MSGNNSGSSFWVSGICLQAMGTNLSVLRQFFCNAPIFRNALAHYIKTCIICGRHQHIYKKIEHTQAFRTHFRLTWSLKPATGTRNPKPKLFKMRPSAIPDDDLPELLTNFYTVNGPEIPF